VSSSLVRVVVHSTATVQRRGLRPLCPPHHRCRLLVCRSLQGEPSPHPSPYPLSSRSSQVTKGWPLPSSGLPISSSCTAGFPGMSVPAGYKQRGRGSVRRRCKGGQHGQGRRKGRKRTATKVAVQFRDAPSSSCVVSPSPPPCRVISPILPLPGHGVRVSPSPCRGCLLLVAFMSCSILTSAFMSLRVCEPCWRQGSAHITYTVEGHDPGSTSAHIP
jgi:hypothetical protein